MEWRIFFIGPMSDENPTDDYKSHLPKLHKYIVSHLETREYTQTNLKGHTPTQGSHVKKVSLERDRDKITVFTPFNLHDSGDIPDEVFYAIDHSDLIIADLSDNRPPVIYELAFVHALGIETILVGGPETISFYFSHTKIFNIDFRAETISSPDLDARIDSWLDKKKKLFNSTNPLQKFYRAPLPDISAARGLAAGFYDNFARPILTGGKIVHREQISSEGSAKAGDDNSHLSLWRRLLRTFGRPAKKEEVSEKISELKGLIVLRPENFASSINEMKIALEEHLNSRFPGEVKRGGPGKIFIKTDEGERTAFFLVRDYLIDIPRTMFSLILSPRLERYTEDKSLKSDMEGVLINRFFESVKDYLMHDTNIKEKRKKFHFGSVEEIPSIIETGESKTWI